jgi:hypothetical protein
MMAFERRRHLEGDAAREVHVQHADDGEGYTKTPRCKIHDAIEVRAVVSLKQSGLTNYIEPFVLNV